MFKMIGKVNEVKQEITYFFNDGKGSYVGDKAIVFLLEWELENKSVLGPVGQYFEANINNPLWVVFALRKCFDSIEYVEGNLPEADSIPSESIC